MRGGREALGPLCSGETHDPPSCGRTCCRHGSGRRRTVRLHRARPRSRRRAARPCRRSSAPSSTPTAPDADSDTDRHAGPRSPAVRWDKVPRGPLPVRLRTVGAARVFVAGPAPSMRRARAWPAHPGAVLGAGRREARREQGPRALDLRQRGAPVRCPRATPRRPSAPARSRCTPGRMVRAVASFVLTWPDGHQVRYRRTRDVRPLPLTSLPACAAGVRRSRSCRAGSPSSADPAHGWPRGC